MDARMKELEDGRSFSIFITIFCGFFSLSGNGVLVFLTLLGIVLIFFYSNEKTILKKRKFNHEYERKYYLRYSICINITATVYSILLLLIGGANYLSLLGLLWGVPNLIYFLSKYSTEKRKGQNNECLDEEMTIQTVSTIPNKEN